MIAGARVEVAPYKRGPMDFVLWKPSSASEPGWESPFGRGRPGWHIECSAMSWKHLGEIFDIHGGGIDLVFPHHENEIAQSCAAFGHEVMANYWMHNGHLQVEGQKMAKSLGNFVTIHELLNEEKFGGKKWPGEVLRLAMLKTQYRQPLDFTVKALEEAYAICGEWFVATYAVDGRAEVPQAVLRPLLDDLNTPAALAAMHELHAKSRTKNFELKASLELLGIHLEPKHFEQWLLSTPLEWDKSSPQPHPALSGSELSTGRAAVPSFDMDVERIRRNYLTKIGLSQTELNNRIVEREAARKNKNWAEADRIRAELARQGIVLKDNKDGTTSWEAMQ
jgi:cysteinyl-tRNA synthetase